MIRRFGDPKVQSQVYTHRVGVYAILVLGDNVLLTYQAEPDPEIQLPGGGIDPGESSLAALHREVLEETGWSIARPRRLGAFRRFTFMPDYDLWAEKLCHIYVARPVRPHGPPREKGHAAIWLPRGKVASALANDGDRHFANQFLG
jgi:8-oxo-dGTP diphosphatase